MDCESNSDLLVVRPRRLQLWSVQVGRMRSFVVLGNLQWCSAANQIIEQLDELGSCLAFRFNRYDQMSGG